MESSAAISADEKYTARGLNYLLNFFYYPLTRQRVQAAAVALSVSVAAFLMTGYAFSLALD